MGNDVNNTTMKHSEVTMTKFLEIKTVHGNIVLINVNHIATIRQGVDVDFNFIYLIDGDCTNTYETIESIKEQLKNKYKMNNINLTIDDLKNISIRIVSKMVSEGIIEDCTDTDISTEFDVQDIITEELCDYFKIEND